MFYWNFPSERDIEYEIIEQTSVFISEKYKTSLTYNSDESISTINLIIIDPDGNDIIVNSDPAKTPDWVGFSFSEDTSYSNLNNTNERKFIVKIECINDAPSVLKGQIIPYLLVLNAFEYIDQTNIIQCNITLNVNSEYLIGNTIIWKNNNDLINVNYPTIDSLIDLSGKNYIQYFTITEGDTKFYDNNIEYDTLQFAVSDITADNIDIIISNKCPSWLILHPTIYHDEYSNPNNPNESLYTTYINTTPVPNISNGQNISFDIIITSVNSIISNSRTINITILSIANSPPIWSHVLFNSYLNIDISFSNTIILPSVVETEDCIFDFVASDINNDNIVYTISGDLPPGLEFNKKGRLTGSITKFIYNTNSIDFNFIVSASDGFISIDKTFYITVYNIGTDYYPHWITQPGLLGTYISGTDIYITLEAIDYLGRNLNFNIESGYLLPDGLNLSSNGIISGKSISYNINMTFTFYIRITPDGGNYDSVRQFSINLVSNNKVGSTLWTDNSFIEDLYEGIPSQLYVEANLIGGENNKIKYIITNEASISPSINDFNIDERNYLPNGMSTVVCGNKLLFIGKPNYGTHGSYRFNVFAYTQAPDIDTPTTGLSTCKLITFNVIQSYMDIYCNINIPIIGKDKNDILKDLINNIPISNLYRICDKNFGFNLNPSIFLIGGLNINQNNLENSFDNFGDNTRPFTVLTGQINIGFTKNYEYLYIPIIDKPSNNLIVNNKYIYSIDNLRKDLINNIGYVNSSSPFEFLPDYMSNYTAIIILCYINLGYGNKILNQIKQLSYYQNLTGKILTIDRYTLEINQGDQSKNMTKYIKLPPGDY